VQARKASSAPPRRAQRTCVFAASLHSQVMPPPDEHVLGGRVVPKAAHSANSAVAVAVLEAVAVWVRVAADVCVFEAVTDGTSDSVTTHGSQRYDCGSDASPHAPW
jgi:hypothetical protein